MAKTKTETRVRTYVKDGKRYEETTVVETREEENGTVTKTTRTTTKLLGEDSAAKKTLASALSGAKTSRGGRTSSSSSSSSSDSSPERKSKDKPKDKAETKPERGGLFSSKPKDNAKTKPEKGGLLSRIKDKLDDSSDDEGAKKVNKVTKESPTKEKPKEKPKEKSKEKPKDKAHTKPEGGGLLSRLKDKLDDSSSSDDEDAKKVNKSTKESLTKDKPKDKPKDKAEHKPERGGLLSKLKDSAKSSDSDSSDDEDFAKGVQKNVNEYRVKHGVAKLKLSKELNKYAKIWAKRLAAGEQMAHNPDTRYGENVYCLSANTTDFDVNAKDVVDKWYSEIKDHKFGHEPTGTSLKTGHFSQLVWKDTKQMGVAKARSAAGTKVFVVANFDPQGNWMGQFADQVPPVGGFPKTATSGKIFHRARKSSSSSSSSSSSESSSDEEDFAEDCLKAHNTYRAKHGAPPLKLSKKLNKHAEEWAEHLAKKDAMQHRQNNLYGENLYCAFSSDPKFKIKGDVAVKSWYDEMKEFRFGREPADLRAGHFTQVVWTDSKELGVAYKKSKSGKIYVVANYNPAGNYVGSFASKVRPLK